MEDKKLKIIWAIHTGRNGLKRGETQSWVGGVGVDLEEFGVRGSEHDQKHIVRNSQGTNIHIHIFIIVQNVKYCMNCTIST